MALPKKSWLDTASVMASLTSCSASSLPIPSLQRTTAIKWSMLHVLGLSQMLHILPTASAPKLLAPWGLFAKCRFSAAPVAHQWQFGDAWRSCSAVCFTQRSQPSAGEGPRGSASPTDGTC